MKYKEEFILNAIEHYKKSIADIRAFKLSQNVENISHQNIVPFATYSPWLDDAEFMKYYEICQNNTLVDIYRMFELWSFVKNNLTMKGDILEVGVWRGGTGCLMAKALELFSDGTVYLADTFSGVVKASENDTFYKGGEHSDTSLEIVEKLIGKLEVKNIQILKGIFPNDLNIELENIKLCHIDVDTYSSAKDIFEYVWDKIISGGAVIFDDYGFWGCEGVTKLVNELKLHDAVFIHNINGHGIFIKK